ncbi:MAG: beta-eliminating lyase-related protein [Azospirillaceae bacterium]
MIFQSDNVSGAAPEILDALARGMVGTAVSYGADPATARLEAALAEVFETEDLAVLPIATGSAANALALALLCPPWGAIYNEAHAHIAVDECGAPEFYTGGAKLVGLAGDHGKLAPGDLEDALAASGKGDVHQVQPAALSLTQATECGTVYTVAEVAALAAVARAHGLGVHMDGARFANAVAATGAAPADLTWRAGVDILSFGGTKNGCLAAEAVILFGRDPAREWEAGLRRKRAGHLVSKMRVISLQLEAYLADGLWLDLARRANARARRLGEGLATLPGGAPIHPVEANEVFAPLPATVLAAFDAAGVGWARWDATTARMVCAFDTTDADVDHALGVARAALADTGAAVS